MTVTRFDGSSLPSGWTAIEPASGSVTVADGYCSLTADAGAIFDSLSSGTTVPEGPRISTAVSGAFDYAVAFASAVNTINNTGVDLLAWNESLSQGIRFAQYVLAISSREVSWYGRRNTSTSADISLTGPSSSLWGSRGWMRMSWDGVDTFTLQSSMTGKPGSWETHATVVDATYTPTTFEIDMTASAADTLSRTVRIAAVVDMTGRADDATTDPGEITRTTVFTSDFTQGSMPAEFTGTTANGGTITHGGTGTTLLTDMDVLDSYSWLVGPGGLSSDHGIYMRYRIPQPSVQNSFTGIAIRAASTTDIPGAQVLTDKYRPGTGFLAELNGAGSFGDIQRYLAAYPIDPSENYDGSQEFYGFSMVVEDLASSVDGSTGDWIDLRLEMIDGYFRAKAWYSASAEPSEWSYEGENYTQSGDNVSIAWAHNDSTTDLTDATMEIEFVEAYNITTTASESSVGSSRMDDLMTELTGLGYTEGSVSDRERARLLSDLTLSSTVAGYSLYDLYEEAGEEPRIP